MYISMYNTHIPIKGNIINNKIIGNKIWHNKRYLVNPKEYRKGEKR